MKLSRKILLLWLASLTLLAALHLLLPSRGIAFAPFLNNAIHSLLFFVCFYLVRREANRRNKFLILNFLVAFSFSFLFQCYPFVGVAIFSEIQLASHYYGLFVSSAFFFFLAVAILYVVVDLLFRNYTIPAKYVVALGIVLPFFIYYYHPIIDNPLYLYTREDIQQFRVLDVEVTKYVAEHGVQPTAIELASRMALAKWEEGTPVGELYFDQKLARIEKLLPYLVGENYRVLLWKPMYLKHIYMNVLMIFFIMLFFGYQYKKDPPQGAYVDKILYAFLLFLTLETFHNWSYIKSVEWAAFSEIFNLGQYVTIVAYLVIVLFFSLRLRFITSVQGEFYESELATNPQLVARWRDGIDNFVIQKFFNPKPIHGRLFEEGR